LRKLQGNAGHRPLNANEPQPTVEAPECPEHLDAAAQAEWKRISAELLTLGLLTSIDRAALAAYCQTWSRWIDAERNIAKYGPVVKSPKSGFPCANPFVGIANRALDLMLKFAIEFGLTPSARSRLQVAPPSSADPFEDFMAGIMDAPAPENEPAADASREVHQ
jgi:P27 family predicted phage terminase small subunit